jgi:hypothetical protein
MFGTMFDRPGAFMPSTAFPTERNVFFAATVLGVLPNDASRGSTKRGSRLPVSAIGGNCVLEDPRSRHLHAHPAVISTGDRKKTRSALRIAAELGWCERNERAAHGFRGAAEGWQVTCSLGPRATVPLPILLPTILISYRIFQCRTS